MIGRLESSGLIASSDPPAERRDARRGRSYSLTELGRLVAQAEAELAAKGIMAGTGYIESTLVRGSLLLKNLGLSEDDVDELVNDFQMNDYALVRAAYAEVEQQAQRR